MSCHQAYEWAWSMAERYQLSTSAICLLLYLVRRANGELVAWPFQETIERATNISPRAQRRLTKELIDAGLIEVGKRGKGACYRILRDPGNDPKPGPKSAAKMAGVVRRTPAKMADVSAAKMAGDEAQTAAKMAADATQTPAKMAGHTGQNGRSTPAKMAALSYPSKEPFTEPCASGDASKQASEQDSGGRKQGAASPSSDPFNDVLDEIAAGRRTSLAAVAVERVSGPVPEPGDPVAAAATGALVAGMARGMFSNYPPRAPRLTREEQIEAVGRQSRLRDVSLRGDALAAMRSRFRLVPVAEEAAD